MLKKTITYVDYNDKERTEVFLFNLTKAEVIEMEMSHKDGLTKTIEKIVAEQDNQKIIAMFKDIILKSYGEKTDDGKQFIKSQSLSEAFSHTEAYSQLFMELATNAESATAFMNGVIPKV